MTASQEILSDLEEQLANKTNQRNALIGQLGLLDVSIDKYDDLIISIDKDCLDIISIINQAILPVKQAYDARVAAGCVSNLAWNLVETWDANAFGSGRFGFNNEITYYKYEVQKNSNTYSSIPYRGEKYYRKPLNRDYGANIIASFYGSVSIGSTVVTITNGSQIPSTIQVGDKIIDNIDNPNLFSSTNIPSITGFGVTSGVGIVTTLVGGISTGSTIFAHYGAGISSVGLNTGMSFNYVGVVTSTIVGFGTTSFNVTYLNQNGVYVTSTESCNSLILSSSASQGLNEGTFTIGIATQFPAVFISTSSLGIDTNVYLSVFRLGDIDVEFDYRQNPSEPLSIGIVNQSTLGVGHSVFLDISGNPSPTQNWSPSSSYIDPSTNQVVNPEPLVGGGKAEYYIGTYQWPTLTTCTGDEIPFCSTNFASEGQVAITSSTSSNAIGYSYSSSVGINTNGATCLQLTQNINNAISNMNAVLAANSSKIQPLINATKSLRSNRDTKELQAWSILQALGSITEEIQRLEGDIDALRNLDFSPYETS